MTIKFSIGGRVLKAAALVAILAGQLFAGYGSFSSYSRPAGAKSGTSVSSDKQATPRVFVDKSSYSAAEQVMIGGEGFERFERVRVAVGTEGDKGASGLVISQWDVYADAKGRISTTWDLPSDGGSFVIIATGDVSRSVAKTEVNGLIAETVSLNQCANTNGLPQEKYCVNGPNSGWVTTQLVNTNARYYEGGFIAYRNVMTGLTPGDSYKWTVKYDVTKGGLNAIDYLGSYNYELTDTNPCADGANSNGFCTAGPATSTFSVPADPKVADGRDQVNGTSDDITQIPGVISAWGATITGVSVPTYSGPFPVGDENATVDITFTAGSSTVVIAWGGHTATRTDWGEPYGSVNITGNVFHTFNGGLMNLTAATSCCGTSQDLQADRFSLTATARITIIKNAAPQSTYPFGFTTSGLIPTSFTLVDDGTGTANTRVFDGITEFNVWQVSEVDPGPYTLTSIACVADAGEPYIDPFISAGYVNIGVKEGEAVTCTFTNNFLTAAEAIVQGRVFDSGARPVKDAWVSATNSAGTTRFARTNQFGFYKIDGFEAGDALFLEVASKRFVFPTQFVTLNQEVNNYDFNGSLR